MLSVQEAFLLPHVECRGTHPSLFRDDSTASLSNAAGTTDSTMPNKASQLNFLLGEVVHIIGFKIFSIVLKRSL